MSATLIQGECVAEMAKMRANSMDSIICDPPYHLTQLSRGGSRRQNNQNTPFGRHRLASTGFAGKDWDGGDVAFKPETWAACLRVAKPGAYLLAFGGDRTFHRLFCAVEDAGWILQGTLCWMYATGLPKALNISKSLDKKAGATRTEVIGRYQPPEMDKPWNLKNATNERTVRVHCSDRNNLDILAPATETAKTWDGWASALKPAVEFICMAMKPLDGTYAENALKWGVAGLNIEGCRKPTCENLKGGAYCQDGRRKPLPGDERQGVALGMFAPGSKPRAEYVKPSGRWPANLLLNEGASSALDAQTGGASRFFFCSKASPGERGEGNDHSTVKPLDLMRWLCRLTKTPSGGVVLDPFCGSGSTLVAAALEGRESIGIDSDPHACEIALKRLAERGMECNTVEESL